MKSVTLIKMVPILAGLMILSSLPPVNAHSFGQATDNDMPGLVTYYSVSEYSSQIPELRNSISLDLKNISLQEALFQIAREANLEIAFDSGVLDGNENITLKNNNIRVADALEFALAGTGYETVI